jgi:AraC-like DNA-binding protein
MNERIRIGQGVCGIERLEVQMRGRGFSLHRHDTYAIGITLSGVQTFWYRGTQRYCLPQQCHILHPDEIHDGSPATETGFRYRIAYLDPSLIQKALGGKPLPFVADPVVDLTPAQRGLLLRIWEMNDEIDDLGQAEIIVDVADALEMASAAYMRRQRMLPIKSLQRVRDTIAAAPASPRTAKDLERLTGLDRWTLARDFRAAFGTSPSRFRTMRQLDQVRRLVKSGVPLAEAALEAGFSDQSHMSRMFKRAFGLTPARWAAATADPMHEAGSRMNISAITLSSAAETT